MKWKLRINSFIELKGVEIKNIDGYGHFGVIITNKS